MRKSGFSLLAAAAALAVSSSGAIAQATPQSACDPAPARATSVQGTVEVRRTGGTQWQALRLNDALCPGDQIRVQERSRADIQLLDQSVLRLNANSTITVEAPKERTTGVVDLVRGAAHFFSRGPRSLEVKTPYTVAGVRGTEFFIGVDAQRAQMIVYEGTVVADSPTGSLTLKDGEAGVAVANKPPVAQVVARPRDAVHWALYYPPVIHAPNAPGYRAQTLLAVGAVDEARSDIGRALQAAPNDANALSLQSIIAVVQGEKDQALQLAQAAVAADPKSATALISRSYAEQARFDLTAARATVQRAVELEPNNALAWARLAELHSSFGDLDASLAAAQRAVQINPNLSRTQTVLGFANLTSIKTQEAKAAFEKAISLDQADPLPRLGMGLALIREGELDRGSRSIEVAASLDPNNALVRSYLGKAYYEEKRGPLDEREFGVARQLDPKDPTPWFYDSIAKQTTNRPVEALQDLEKARELNDNRAVYRSQLLLDSDAAARAASQARIYSELGFEQRALVEGWDAVNRDPSSFSAHRFLADSYSALPRHQVARVSELLQSQLLSPVTNTPLQPRLAVTNPFLLSSLGPGTASFNEFNPLFSRDGPSLLASGLAGSNETWSGEGVISGIKGKAAYSLGYSQFETDGFRENNDQTEKLGNLFLQYDFTPSTSAQFEYRNRESERGDLHLGFFPDAFRSTFRTEEEIDTYRLGMRHAFSPASILLGSVIVQDAFMAQRENPSPSESVSIQRPEDATSAEIQHIYRSSRFTLTSGAGYSKIKGTEQEDINLSGTLPFPPFFFSLLIQSSTPFETEHTNFYSYANYNLTPALTLTVGLSADFVDGTDLQVSDQESWNPKFGLVWRPTSGTTVRAAAFQALKRTLVTEQTLEPTQVAGFNQFFDDAPAAKSKRYGLGVDQKFSRDVFAGAEISMRDLDSPFTTTDSNGVETRSVEERKEYLGRLYAYWTPHKWVALRAEYIYEKFDNELLGVELPLDLTTHRVPLGISVFHPSGLGAGVTVTYYDQEGQFVQGPGSDKFWLLDLAARYRLPKRYGVLAAGVRNVTDEKFNYFDVDTKNPRIAPDRMAFIQLTLALP